MANSGFSSIHNIPKDVNFDNGNTINSDVLCKICNEVLIDAHSAPCGCRYCLECISAYLDGEDEYCPGNTDNCKNELLNINNNILIDHPMNIKISRLIVKCPERECGEKIELGKLDDHIRVCQWRPTNCPFHNVGCRNVEMMNDKLEQHLLSENHVHTKLLMDNTDILKNEFGQLKEDMNATVREMKEEMQMKWRVIRNGESKIEQLKLKASEIETELSRLRDSKAEVTEIRTQSLQMSDTETELIRLRDANTEVRQMRTLSLHMIEMATELSRLKVEVTEIEKLKTELLQMREKIIGKLTFFIGAVILIVVIVGIESSIRQLREETRYGGFVWQIGELSNTMKKDQICSGAFFSHKNGYKMYLCASPSGFGDGKGSHFSVSFHLILGPFDDILVWPFKYDVTFSIVNKVTRLNHVSGTINTYYYPTNEALKQPLIDKNPGLVYTQLIKLDELLSNAALSGNDRIIIKCTVKIY